MTGVQTCALPSSVHCRYVHWHFRIGVPSGYISGIGILGYGVLVIGISAVAFCPDTAVSRVQFMHV